MRLAIIIVGVMLSGLLPVAEGGMIIVSGDSNITVPLASDIGTTPGSSNDRFFLNVLGGGSKVVFQNDNIPTFSIDLTNFYTSHGVTVATPSGSITSADLAGASTYIGILPNHTFTASEVSTLTSFLAGGGNVFLLGDYVATIQGITNGYITQDANINSDLVALGSTIRIIPDAVDESYHLIGTSNIATNPLTSGVDSLIYAFTSRVSGGTTLFTTLTGKSPFIAAESIGPTAVPEPPSLVLAIGGGLFMLISSQTRKKM